MDSGADTRGIDLDESDGARATLLAAIDEVKRVLAANADEAQTIGTLPEPAWRCG